MKKFRFKWFSKNLKRRRIVVGIAIGLIVLAATIITAVYMDAVVVTLNNSNPEAGRLLGGGLITHGSRVTIRAQANPGYVFLNWTNVDGSIASAEKDHSLSVPASDIELTANWKITDWELDLVLDSTTNTTIYPDKFTVKSDVIYLNNPTKDGYTFLGWYKDPAFKEEANDYIPAGTAKNMTLYAKWAESYEITYDLSDERASNDPDNPATYTAESNVVLEIPTCYELKDGKQTGGTYNFLGWYDPDGNKVDVIRSEWKKPITLKARWDYEAGATYFSTFEKGKYTYVNIGRYPQHILEDQRTIAEIKAAIANHTLLPDESTGYYTYKGILYAKVTANPYQKNTYFSNDVEVEKGKEYFFIVEPITWRVLSGNPNDPTSEVLLLSEDVLTAHIYQANRIVRSYEGETVYANNWERSDIRDYLNGEFYETVFMPGERTFIRTTAIDFSKRTSHFDKYANGKTSDDTVFLLSYADTANRSYGWDHWTRTSDSRKVGKATDYAKAMGVYASLNAKDEHDAAHWWLRSPGDFEARAALTTALGTVGTYEVDCAAIGVRPAIKVKFA